MSTIPALVPDLRLQDTDSPQPQTFAQISMAYTNMFMASLYSSVAPTEFWSSTPVPPPLLLLPPPPPNPIRPEHYFTYPRYPDHIHYQIATFFIEGKIKNGVILPSANLFDIQVWHPSGIPCQVYIQEDHLYFRRYMCTFQATDAGAYCVSVQLHINEGDGHIQGSPFNILVSRSYDTSIPHIIYGLPGLPRYRGLPFEDPSKSPVKLWGIDTDHVLDKLYMTDKIFHQVRVISTSGIELTQFGKEGSGPNEFYRPTGLAVDATNRRLLISDKDNHRICFYSLDGIYIGSFGEKGHLDGELQYPWGVSVSPNGNLIAVADSRNHRIQLFDKNGRYMKKFTVFETNPFEYKEKFDYPRGICFDTTGERIYVTDFNTHTVSMFTLDLASQYILVPPGKLTRPQGLAVDMGGNVLVCDSRSNCIRVITPHGFLLHTIYGLGSQFSLPQDICILRSGQLVILDAKGTIRVY